MKEYLIYKEWWIDHVAPVELALSHSSETAEEAFRQHIDSLTLYRLMEELCLWSSDEN